MDDRRFDALVKALANGSSRRTLFKGLLGLGGAAAVGSTVLEPGSEAARRPTPTPRPPTCPGKQTPQNGKCVCLAPPAAGTQKCGPDCCNPGVSHTNPAWSECCDSGCCLYPNDCVGEELCCPRLPDAGCLDAQGRCCATQCSVTPGGPVCCPADDFCPGGSTSADLCCAGNTTCCGAGTNANTCMDLTVEGTCCDASDCGPPAEGTCGWDCSAGQCVSFVCVEGSICCQGACVSSSTFAPCPADPNECCNTSSEACCGAGGCCSEEQCNPVAEVCCSDEYSPCGTGGDTCCPPIAICCGDTCCSTLRCTTADECCSGVNIACGAECCPEERCTPGVGCCPEGFLACSGGICCSAAVYQCATDGPGCECKPGTEACGLLPGGCCAEGRCNTTTGECCDPGTTPCGSVCCLEGLCDAGVCTCTNGLVRCGDACQECCAADQAENCQVLYGYDLNCVYCGQGVCDPTLFNGSMCDTDDTNALGKCQDGFCIPCGGGASAPCEFNEDCCSGNCQANGQCTDP